MIYSERILQARELSGMTQRELAEKIGIARSTIAHIETGRSRPSTELLENIAKATYVRPTFFEQPPTPAIAPGSLTYRVRKGATGAERDKARQYARLCIEQLQRMAQKLNLPILSVPSGEDPTTAAANARYVLGLDEDKPIPNLINVLERNGFMVIALPFELARLDAFSTWTIMDQERPVIVVSSGKPGDRVRFSVAHELGHIVLHKGLRGDYVAMENEANLFAGAFLLPERPMRELIPTNFNLTTAARLKLRWGVSMQLLVRRAKDLGIIPDRKYRYLCERISALGWRKQEPANLAISVEKPRTFRKMVQLCYDPLQDSECLATDMHITHGHAQMLLSQYSLGLTSATVEGTEEYLYLGNRHSLN